MKINSYETFFANFTSPSKLRIITALTTEPLSVSQIALETGMEQSNVSHHLSVLSDCNIVQSEQVGKHRIYSVNKKTVLPLFHIAQMHTGNCSPACKKECALR